MLMRAEEMTIAYPRPFHNGLTFHIANGPKLANCKMICMKWWISCNKVPLWISELVMDAIIDGLIVFFVFCCVFSFNLSEGHLKKEDWETNECQHNDVRNKKCSTAIPVKINSRSNANSLYIFSGDMRYQNFWIQTTHKMKRHSCHYDTFYSWMFSKIKLKKKTHFFLASFSYSLYLE